MITASQTPAPPRKPPPLRPGAKVAIIAPSSPFDPATFAKGVHEIERLGLRVVYGRGIFERDGYFAGTAEQRAADLLQALADESVDAVFCARGGFGASQLLEFLDRQPDAVFDQPKILLGYSDLTVLHSYLWRRARWITFQGPMAACGFHAGENQPSGYDAASFRRAVAFAAEPWEMDLRGAALAAGEAEGRLLGGCLTMLETTLGTPWEFDSAGAILLLEDRAMKPYQVDRSLLHLRQAGKFAGLHGVILGDFPDGEAPAQGGVTVEDVFARHFGGLRIPVAAGSPIGHTTRPMLTLPLGVRAHLRVAQSDPSGAAATLRVLESACAAPRQGN